MTTHTETMWAIACEKGLYRGTWWTRKMARNVHVWKRDKSWRTCHRLGDRFVKVTITYEYPE